MDDMLVGHIHDILDDSSVADSENSVQESDITSETEFPASLKSISSTASTVITGSIGMPSTTDNTPPSSSSAASSGVSSLLSCLRRPTSSELSRKRGQSKPPS